MPVSNKELTLPNLQEKISDLQIIGVRVSCEIIKMVDIEQQFKATGYVEVSWPSTGPDTKGGIQPDVECVFNIDSLLFENALVTQVNPGDVSFSRENGLISGSIGYSADVAMDCDLRRFPFDRHYLVLKIPIIGNGTSRRLRFKHSGTSPSFVGLLGGLSDKWKMLAPELVTQAAGSSEKGDDDDSPTYVLFLMPIQRFPGFIFWKIVFPVFILGCLAMIVFAFPADTLSPRLATIMTLVLTSMVFKNLTTAFLPAVPYLTLIDFYLNMSLVLLVTVALEITWAYVSTNPSVNHIDNGFAWIFSVVWVFGHIIAAGCVFSQCAYEPWQAVKRRVLQKADDNCDYQYGPPGDEELKVL
jgi:hypothetical protein